MPTRDTAWPNGTPCWVDYSAGNMDAVKAFYADVFGWTFSDGDPQFGGYLLAFAKDREAAGIAPAPDPSMPPTWTTYFATDDVDAAVGRVEAAGGSVRYPPMDVGPVGRMAIAADPQGNAFGLWQAGEHIGVRIFNEPGSVIWNDAALDDPAAAQAFYTAVFGFRFEEIDAASGYATFATDSAPLGGFGSHQPGSAKGWAVCFSVASADATVRAVEAGGGKVRMAPQDMPYGRFAVVEDPWGAPFSVMNELPG